MAKKGGNQLPGLRQALRVVDKLGTRMTAEADADYAVALSALRAGQQGLSKQTRALTRDMLAGQLTQTTGLSKLAKQASRQVKKVEAEKGRVTNRYGSALGQQVASSYAPAAAAAKGTKQVVKGAAKAGKRTMKVGQTVAGIAQAGVAAQQAAAKYSLNQALQQRAIVDNQTLAALTGDLYKTALSYNMQMAMYERQRADALADARKAEVGQTKDTVEWLTSTSGEMGAWLQEADEIGKYETDGKFDLAKAMKAYKTEMGLDPAINPRDADQLALMTVAMRYMAQGQDASSAMQAAMNELFQSQAGWEKLSPSLLASTDAYIGALMDAKAVSNLEGLEGVTINTGGIGVGSGALINTVSLGLLAKPETWDPQVATQYRDAAAAALREQYGASTAKAWLRGQTEWSDDAIDSYLDMLPAELAGQLNYNE